MNPKWSVGFLFLGIILSGTACGGVVTVETPTPTSSAATLSIDGSGAFGIVTVGEESELTLAVTKGGETAATEVSASGLSAPFTFKGGSYPGTGATCSTTISGDCTVTLVYTPTEAGNDTATLSLSYFDGTATQSETLDLTGTGEAADDGDDNDGDDDDVVDSTAASLSVSDGATYNFGTLNIITETASKTFTVSNSGDASATSLTGSGLAAPFTFSGGTYPGSGGTCGTTLASGASCTVIISYDPTTVATHSDTLVMTYHNNQSAGQTATRAIQGTGVSEVLARYPNNGLNWNDYVLNDGNDTTCNAYVGSQGYNGCLHGGEKKMVYVPSTSSCTGLAATDSLGAFDWTCDSSTNPVRMVSTGLNTAKNLSDLIDFVAVDWRDNSVSVTLSGDPVLTTTSEQWWSNEVTVDNDGGTLSTAGTICLVTTANANDYTISSNQVTLLIKNGVTQTGSVSASSLDRIWIEGSLNPSGDLKGIIWSNIARSVMRNVSVEGASQSSGEGISLTGSSSNYLKGITVSGSNKYGIHVRSSTYNTFTDTTISNTTATNGAGLYLESDGFQGSDNNSLTNTTIYDSGKQGLHLSSSSSNTFVTTTIANSDYFGLFMSSASSNVFSSLKISNSLYDGINMSSSGSNTFINVLSTNNGDRGVYLLGSTNNIFKDVTTANNNGAYGGFYIGSNYTVLSNVLTTNNAYGLFVNSSNNTFENIIAAHNTTAQVYLTDSPSNHFTGILKVDSSLNPCIVSGVTSQGLVNNSCANADGSDATLTTSVTLASSVIGKVSSDTANTGDSSGTATSMSGAGWINFDNSYRAWGLNSADAFPNASHRDRWDGSTGTGRIWDWSLATGDTVALGRLSAPGDSDTIAHTWSSGSSTYFRNATETIGDDIGNDDGLCDQTSGEACLYTPNIGAYQGHGSLTSDGLTPPTGVTLVKYGSNGR